MRDSGFEPGPDVRQCVRCGALAHSGSNYCAQCGWSLSDDARSPLARLTLVDERSADDKGAEYPRAEDKSADRPRPSRPTSPFERRQLTVVFCDLVDSTTLATQADPEDFNDAIEDFYRVVAQSVGEFGGYVARYIGDGALIYFGYPQAHEDDAERAVHAALATLARVKERKRTDVASLQIRIGIATGLVVVGNLHATVVPGALDIAGEAAHVAARLQGSAQPGTVLVDANTRRMLGDLFEWQALGSRHLKGIAEPVEVWQALDAKQVANRFEAQRGAIVTPMLDRDGFRTTLLERWHEASAGNGGAVLISGDAGIGKSRLAASIADDVGGDAT